MIFLIRESKSSLEENAETDKGTQDSTYRTADLKNNVNFGDQDPLESEERSFEIQEITYREFSGSREEEPVFMTAQDSIPDLDNETKLEETKLEESLKEIKPKEEVKLASEESHLDGTTVLYVAVVVTAVALLVNSIVRVAV